MLLAMVKNYALWKLDLMLVKHIIPISFLMTNGIQLTYKIKKELKLSNIYVLVLSIVINIKG
jgi:hypothetical protein